MQRIIKGNGEAHLLTLLSEAGARRPFLVCDGAFSHLPCAAWQIARAPRFSGFAPNPRQEDIFSGVRAFAASSCDALVAIGGGSAMDTAKCIRAFCRETQPEELLSRPVRDCGLPLIAVPTTAGTGSESTHFAVAYAGGVKHSIAHESLRPGFVLLSGDMLRTLPPYQKKCTLLDALCQAIESAWSRRASVQSRALSAQAAQGILRTLDLYLSGDPAAAQAMLEYANLSGQAIDITTTTAVHAMSYKLTSLYALPHGHAVAICLPPVWRQLLRGGDLPILTEIAAWLGVPREEGPDAFEKLLSRLDIRPPRIPEGDLDLLTASVNAQRLANHPQALDAQALRALYQEIAKSK